MYFDAFTAAAIADELSATIHNGFVQRVVLPDRYSVALEIYSQRRRRQLLLTADPSHSRVLLVSDKPTAQPGLTTPFGLLLRKYVLDGAITTIEQPAGERVITLSISKSHETNNGKSVSTVWLHAELMGRHANLMLLDADRKTIIESVKRVTPEMSRVRPVLPQRPFSPPPPRAGIHAHRVTPDALEALVAAARENSTLVQVLVSGVAGLSPLSSREVVYRAEGDVGIKAAEWTDWPRLALELRRLASLWATREHRPFVARFEDGSTAYAPYELQHLAGSAELVEFTSMSEAVEQYKGGSPSIVSHDQLRDSILAALDRRVAIAQRRLDSLRREASGADDAQRLMEEGRLVLTYSHTIPHRATELVLDDRTIALDPALTPSENAQELFDAYKRRRRAGEDLPEKIAAAGLDLEQLEEYKTFARLARGHVELSQLRAELLAAVIIQEGSTASARTSKPPTAKTASFTTPTGVRVLVGKSAAQNARVLVTASPDDWWFHAREIPGAHVVARTGGPEPDAETAQSAAETAAYYSSSRESGSVDVIYTQLRHVRKIKGAGPGQVTYRNERGLRAAPRDHLDGG